MQGNGSPARPWASARARIEAGRWSGRLALIACLAAPGARAACDPGLSCCLSAPATGSPCGGAGVATLGNGSGTPSGAGNPIHLITGNKFQREVDMAPLPGVLGLELIRYYNSADHDRGLLGRGWRLSYETRLRRLSGGRVGALEIVQADGTRIVFAQRPRQGEGFVGTEPLHGSVQALNGRHGTEYLWQWGDGRQLRFNPAGHLEQIRVPSGEFLSLHYDERGWLSEVIDPAGRRLSLHPLSKAEARDPQRYRGVQSIDTPVGRFLYAYGEPLPAGSSADPSELIANLRQVTHPSVQTPDRSTPAETLSRVYHHEDPRFPTLLTGISQQSRGSRGEPLDERLNTWAYDAQGRAILSFKGERPAAGAAAEQVALQRGPERHGQGTTRLTNSLGQTTEYRHTTIAGAPRLLQAIGPACASCPPGDVRYRYDLLGRLTEETTLDAQGQPRLSIRTERDAEGRPVRVSSIRHDLGQAQPPQLRVRYAYERTRDDSSPPSLLPVLLAVPSVVPGRERITRIAYNDAMQPLSVTEEGFSPVDDQGRSVPHGVAIRRTTTYSYARLNGRSVLVSIDGPLPNGPGNSPADSDISRFEWDARADRLLRVIHPGQRRFAVQAEPGSGRITGITGPGGVNLPLPPAVADWHSSPQPGRHETERYSQSEVAAPPRIEYDPWSRPVAWRSSADTEAQTLLRASWGPPGSVAESSVLGFATPHAQAQRRLDDFGRVVAIRLPAQAWQFARYDEAGRLIEATDPRGARQRVRWDLAGRLVRLEHFAPATGASAATRPAEQLIERRYEGERLVQASISDRHGRRITRFSHDPRGALVAESLSIEPAGELIAAMPEPLRLGLSYRRDADGRLERMLMGADGRSLRIDQSLLDGRPARIGVRGVLPRWLGGGREIVQRVDWQEGVANYATAIAHGDGSVDHFEPVSVQAWDSARRARANTGAGLPSRAPADLALDEAGLPERVQSDRGIQRLRWNAAAQLERSERDDGSRSDYVYDAQGRRVIKLVTQANGQTQIGLSLYEENRLVAEADARGRLSHGYAYLGHRPVAQIPLQHASAWQGFKAWLLGPETRHLHTALAGRVLSVSERGRTVWLDDQAPAASAADGPPTLAQAIHQPLRYVGQYHDSESGLSYHGARYFEPGQGRFISPDPAGVVDALNDVPAGLLLDLYVYAGGRPEAYFDPDGAARIRYFAITSDAQGKALGMQQGFVKARWAFIVDQVQAGGDAGAQGRLRNAYASADTALLVDVAGSFLGGGQAARTWGGADNPMATDFFKHYGEALISIPAFTIENMSDDQATALIASYIAADREKVFGAACPVRAALLPPIRFAPGEADIHVDLQREAAVAGMPGPQANVQRILNCQRPTAMPVVYANDEERRRIVKYEAAAELQESPPTSAIYKDCSADHGCRSHTAIEVNGHRYYASYGRTQFVVETFLRTLQANADSMSAAQNKQLRLDQAVRLPDGSMGTMWEMVRFANQRARSAATKFRDVRNAQGGGLDALVAAQAWDSLSPKERIRFQQDTGLGRLEYIDMLGFKPEGRARTEAEARNAFASEAAMRLLDGDGKTSFGDWLMWLYSSRDEYNFVSKMFLKRNLSTVMTAPSIKDHFVNKEAPGSDAHRQRQRIIEDDLAQRVAAMHNWGKEDRVTAPSMNLPRYVRDYVNEFVRTPGRGDWRSLRCSDELKKLPGTSSAALEIELN